LNLGGIGSHELGDDYSRLRNRGAEVAEPVFLDHLEQFGGRVRPFF
jgi:hypothetical protein